MNGLLRKKIDISFLKKIDTRFGDSALWQFVKFNLVSFSITLLQLALANLLPLIFDGVTAKLPPVLRPVFRPEALFEGHSPYTFRGKGSRSGLVTYLMILSLLILFSTWLQGWITARLSATTFAALGRTIAAAAAGLVQVAVLFPLEKYVLFKKE